jgi:hypothetical protein
MAMTLQTIAAVGFVLLSACIALIMARQRVWGHLGWIIASGFVMLGGIAALWLAHDWAGWLTGALFLLLIAAPRTLLNHANRAAQDRNWATAARLSGWAALLHPSPWTRFDALLSRTAARPSGYAAALEHIEATGASKQKARARLMLAQEQQDWQRLLTLSRGGDAPFSEAKPREVLALGELGRLDEMAQVYQEATKSLPAPARQDCMLMALAFTGRVDRLRRFLEEAPFPTNDRTKSHWTAVARLRSNTDGSLSQPLSDESARVVDAIKPEEVWRFMRARQWAKRTRKTRLRAALILTLIIVVWVVLQRYYQRVF